MIQKRRHSGESRNPETLTPLDPGLLHAGVTSKEESYADFTERTFERAVAHDIKPLKAQFEITYRCNIHCLHCYTDPFNRPNLIRQELPLEDVYRILDEMKEAGVLWLLLTGGEALLHPYFREIYWGAKARGFVVSLFSNATVLTQSHIDFLAENPPFQLEVSLHGATQETYERITQVPGSFAKCMEAIQRLIARGLPLRLKANALTANRDELPALRRLFESLGQDFSLYTAIYPRLNGDLSSTHYRLTPAEIVALEMGNIIKSSSPNDPVGDPEMNAGFPLTNCGNDGNSMTPPPDDRLYRCGCGTTSVIINPYGQLRACTFTVEPSFDLRRMPFAQAFQSLSQDIRARRYQGESLCRSCPAYTLCDKNPAMAVYEAGSAEAPVSHFCEVAFGKRRAILKSPLQCHSEQSKESRRVTKDLVIDKARSFAHAQNDSKVQL